MISPRALHVLLKNKTTSKYLLPMSQKMTSQQQCHVSPHVRTKTTFEVIKPISHADVHAFAALTGDSNPIHMTGGDQAIVHGALLMGYVSGAIGASCPGALVVSQQMKFSTPCPVNTTVKVKIEFVEHRKITECNFACVDQANEDIMFMIGSAKLRIKQLS